MRTLRECVQTPKRVAGHLEHTGAVKRKSQPSTTHTAEHEHREDDAQQTNRERKKPHQVPRSALETESFCDERALAFDVRSVGSPTRAQSLLQHIFSGNFSRSVPFAAFFFLLSPKTPKDLRRHGSVAVQLGFSPFQRIAAPRKTRRILRKRLPS